MPIAGFDHYNLSAHRGVLDVLRDFYIHVVGLRLGPRPELARFGYWLYAGDVAVLHLSVAAPDDLRSLHVRGTFNHAAFRASGCRTQLARLKAHGVAVRIAEDEAQQIRQLFFKDPAGNGVELAFPLDDLG